MAEVTCPTLNDFTNADRCAENIGGMSNVVYIGVKSDLKAELAATNNLYGTPVFNTGKGLYKLELKDESQQINGESQGSNKGYNLSWKGVVDVVNKEISMLTRAINNLDIFLICPDGGTGETQIMYDPFKRVKVDSGGITSDTGAASGDDRQTSLELKLNGVKYQNLYVTAPEAGWDSLLASKSVGS